MAGIGILPLVYNQVAYLPAIPRGGISLQQINRVPKHVVEVRPSFTYSYSFVFFVSSGKTVIEITDTWSDVLSAHSGDESIKFLVIQSPFPSEFAQEPVPQFGLYRFAIDFGTNRVAEGVKRGNNSFEICSGRESLGHLF
jgi:hypothetical protein